MIKSKAQPIKLALYLLLILLTIISVGTLFWQSYPLELFSNFRVYYLLAAGILAIAFYIGQKQGWSAKFPIYLALGLIAFNSASIFPWYLPHSQQGSGKSIRVLTFNINVANNQWDAIASAIRQVNPDIATIIEITPQGKEQLSQRLNANFPFSYRTSGGGIAIFSQLPLTSFETKTLTNGSMLVASLKLNGKEVNLIAVHPMVPIKPALFKRRNAFLTEIATYVRQIQKKPLILLGDFNLTPWSPYYSKLVGDTKLHNTRLGFGVEPSWIEAATHVHHPSLVTATLKIPIDHIFVSQDFKVADCHTTKAANADHRMLWSDLVG